MFRVDRHELGPRLHVLGRRIHECHLGLGMHRVPTPLRARARAHRLAPLAGACTVAMGLVNVASALTPDEHSRVHLLLALVPREVPVAAHALALSAGVTLVILGLYLMRRRRRAWALAVTILVVAGALNLLKGLDVEEAFASWALAALLVWGRDAFCVMHEEDGWGGPLVLSACALGGAVATSAVALIAAAHWGTPRLTPSRGVAELVASLTLAPPPIHYRDPFDWVPGALDVLWLGAALIVSWLLFRPLAAARGLPPAELRPLAREMVERHGSDTLSFFKLRADKHHFFDSTRRAFVGYRIEAGVLLVSGDPIGPPSALPGLLRELSGFAEMRGLAVGGVGASEEFAALGASAGLRSFYIGDEAIVDLAAFSLEGRSIRKVRQAVARARKAGFTAAVHRLGDLSESELGELEALSARWRGDEPERGFSMSIDSLRGEHLSESLVVVARDAEETARGFLHFAPCYGRPAMSLGSMRRDRDSVNGLTEYLVVSAVEMLRERGIEEISLNFAAFARLLRSPNGIWERTLGRIVTLANPHFQIESLYRFNAKFSPRWQPRYLLYERRPLGFARTGFAAMWAEGQLPSPIPRAMRLG